MRRAWLVALGLLAPLASTTGCGRGEHDRQADAVCLAVEQERFEDALALSQTGADGSAAGRAVTQCRCIAQLSLGDRDSCTTMLAGVLETPEAADWVPQLLLSKLMVRRWQADGDFERAATLAERAAPVHREDLELLQLEIALRSRLADESEVLAAIAARLDAELEWLPQRLVLALAWNRRGDYARALDVLGAETPPIEHPLALAWYESRIKAQAGQGDEKAVRETFARWREAGWDPIDLDARYALRLSTDHLNDPTRDGIELLRAAIANQDRISDPKVVWGLHRRLITDLLAAGRPREALAAYDRATEVVALEGVSRSEIERAIRQAERPAADELPGDRRAIVRFELPSSAAGGRLAISPPPDVPPDAGYRLHAVLPGSPIEIEAVEGRHPLRWVLHSEAGRTLASGSVWPEAGHTVPVRVELRGALPPVRSWQPARREPADGRRRVFAVLPDCGDWRLTEYLRARSDLPFHDHLFSQGFRAVLESRPAFTAAAMQALVWPAPHERPTSLGWIHRLGLEVAGLESVGRNPVEFLTWLLPERPNLFETIGRGPIATANMLLSHGRIDAGQNALVIGPDGRRRRLASPDAYRVLTAGERARHPALDGDPDLRRFSGTIAAEMDAAEAIAEAGEIDFLLLRLESLDLITHGHFAAIDGRGQDDGRGALFSAYRYIDERLASLHALLDEDDWLVVLSDHGIRSSMQHEEDAIFVVAGAGVPQGRAPGRPALRGIPRTFASMFGVVTDWPETGAAPWLDEGRSSALVAEVRDDLAAE